MIHKLLENKQIILASASPRRKEIFDLVGIKALQMPADIEEKTVSQNPIKLVKFHAKNKALAVRNRVNNDNLIVAADTIVFADKRILEKPKDKFQAAQFLTELSDNFHYVYTGIAVSYKNQIYVNYEKTRVEFSTLSAKGIENYIETNEPFDKAGAYGIQGFGSQFVKKISGCYFNVMGFPISLFYKMLKEIL